MGTSNPNLMMIGVNPWKWFQQTFIVLYSYVHVLKVIKFIKKIHTTHTVMYKYKVNFMCTVASLISGQLANLNQGYLNLYIF